MSGGKQIFNRQLKRNKVFEFLAQYPGVVIVMEACCSSSGNITRKKRWLAVFGKQIKQHAMGNEPARRLMGIKGVAKKNRHGSHCA